jgi:hypothetical protein
MIRKPPADWNRTDEGAAVRTVRTAATVAKGSAEVARRGQQAIAGLMCFVFAAIWAPLAIMSGLDGSLPSFIGIGALAASAVWLGCRAFVKAFKAPG